jgi:thiol-disulfide isomerase/thioredoxin
LYNGVVSWVRIKPVRVFVGIGVLVWAGTDFVGAQEKPEQNAPAAKVSGGKQTAPTAAALEQQDLQKAIEQASNDRAALMRNLLEFLKKYPQTAQRPQIYRAIVESSLQLRDFSTATEYAERMVALDPGDASTNLLAIQLLERHGDATGWRRAVNYCARVLEIVHRESAAQKSPRQSSEQFEKDRQHDVAAVLLVRGQLYQKLNEPQNAQKDFENSYKMAPGAPAAEHLGELAELRKDLPGAIHEYGVAFALADTSAGSASRPELRKKLGNAWRLAHGSEDGLGDYLLRVYDETAAATTGPKPARNTGRKEPSSFVLRKVSDGSPFAMADTKGKVVVMNFWTTWCGPCREWEPHFEKVAGRFAGQEKDVVFFGMNCDEDETLVGPYLADEKPKTSVLFADGLDRLLGVDSFPTTLVLDRAGKIAYRAEGMDMDNPEASLTEAIEKTLRLGEMAPAGVAE